MTFLAFAAVAAGRATSRPVGETLGATGLVAHLIGTPDRRTQVARLPERTFVAVRQPGGEDHYVQRLRVTRQGIEPVPAASPALDPNRWGTTPGRWP